MIDKPFDYRNVTFETKGCRPLWSCPALMANEGVTGWPLVYFRKPKFVPQHVFDDLIKRMRISVEVRDAG